MTSPLWLSHHHEHQADRCIRVGDAHVAAVAPFSIRACSSGRNPSPDGTSGPGIVLKGVMPLGVVGEWISEHLLGAAYSASRQIVATALASVSFGVALGRHVRHPFEAASTAPAVTFTLLCLVVWFIGARRRDPASTEWEAEFESAEEQRLDALLALLEDNGLEAGRPDQPASQTKSMSSSTAPTNDGLRSL